MLIFSSSFQFSVYMMPKQAPKNTAHNTRKNVLAEGSIAKISTKMKT